jgi:aminoglycoside 3-N-acetyltransferase
MSREKIEAALGVREWNGLAERERLALEYADRVSATPVDVPDEFFARLRSLFSEREIVELTGHIAHENYNAKSNRPLRVEQLLRDTPSWPEGVVRQRARMQNGTVSRDQLVQQLLALGVQPGGVLLVHTSFSKVRPVEDGPMGLIAALRTTLGAEGTLVMPSMTSDDDHPFDPKTTACVDMGMVADTFWRLARVLRSDNPAAFAALGPQAARIIAPHPVDPPHGLESPVGRVYELDGQVLLLGVGHDSDTTIHLAEFLANVRYRRKKHLTILKEGKPVRCDYREIDHCCQKFNLVDRWLDESGLQRKGHIGHAEARLASSRDIVAVVTKHLRTNETSFLHPKGVDPECDEARDSLTLS